MTRKTKIWKAPPIMAWAIKYPHNNKIVGIDERLGRVCIYDTMRTAKLNWPSLTSFRIVRVRITEV